MNWSFDFGLALNGGANNGENEMQVSLGKLGKHMNPCLKANLSFRAVISTGWSTGDMHAMEEEMKKNAKNIMVAEKNGDVFLQPIDISRFFLCLQVIGSCSHSWLFPRCRAIVHHGG